MFLRFLFVNCILSTAIAQFDAGLDDDFENGFDTAAASVVLEHSLDQGLTWAPRATINLRSLKADNAAITQSDLTSEDRRKFKVLLKNNGFYKLRVASRLNLPSQSPSIQDTDMDEGSRYVSTFLRACALFDAALNDRITLHLGSKAHVIGISSRGFPVSYDCSITSTQGLDESLVAERLSGWTTDVDVTTVTQGPAPDTLTFVQKMEREAAERAKGEQQDNRSFFAKYWMYIVPAVILLVMQSAAAPEGN